MKYSLESSCYCAGLLEIKESPDGTVRGSLGG